MKGNPFLKAMEISKGTVIILDKDCEVYSRIWCIYELYKSLMDKKYDYKFDVYTEHDWQYNYEKMDFPKDCGDAIGLIDGFINSDNQNGSPNPTFKQLRESQFPLERILKAGSIDIKKAKASDASDETYIKNIITNQNKDDAPPEHHDNYDKLNDLIRGFFVSSNLQRIVMDGSISKVQKSNYFNILKQSSATDFYLNMYSFFLFNDSIASQIAVSLPFTIKSFTIITDGSHVTNNGIQKILKGLVEMTNLEMLVLSKNNIDDEACSILADVIRNNKNMMELDLRDNNIGHEGVKAISDALQNNNSLEILLLDNNQINEEGAKVISVVLKVMKSLKKLGLLNNKIGDEGAIAIGNGLKENVSLKELELGRNGISDKGVKQIITALRINKTLKKLSLDMNKISTEGAKELANSLCTHFCPVGLAHLNLQGNRLAHNVVKDITTILKEKNVTLKYGFV